MKRLVIFLLYCNAVPAQTGGPGIGTTYYASKSGAILDCNLATGTQIGSGGTCTNNDTLLETILNYATSTSPITLVLDGPTITAGLMGPATGYWTVLCPDLGDGLYLANSSTSATAILANSVFHGAGTPGTPGNDIEISGCFFNVNKANNSTAVSAVYLDNVQHVRLQNDYSINDPWFNFYFNAVKDVELLGLTADESNWLSSVNGDGIHIDGPSSNIKITDADLITNDDGIALNAAEGYGGPIANVSINGEHCHPCDSFLRELANESGLTPSNEPVTGVTLNNFSGTISASGSSSLGAFNLGYNNGGGTAADLMELKASNGNFTLTSSTTNVVFMMDNAADVEFSNVMWKAPVGAAPWIYFNGTVTISNFVCTACTIYRNTAGSAAAFWATITAGASITKATFLGSAVTDGAGGPYSATPYAFDVQSGGSLGSLNVPALDMSLTSALLNGNQWSRVTTANGILINCGTTSTCSTSAVTSGGGYIKRVIGSAPLVSGTPSTVTIGGFPVAFASTGSFVCTATDRTAAANNLLSVANTSTSSITITGPNAITDVVGYSCEGT